jgi:thiamine biosynthesis lipoprotein
MRTSIALLILALSACERPLPQNEVVEGEAAGVSFRVRLGERLAESERAEIERMVAAALDGALAQVDSDLAGVAAEVEVSISPPTFEILREAARVSELTGGAFDVTVPPLARLWGFGAAGSVISVAPTEEQIAAARARVGFRRLEIDDDAMSITSRGGPLDVDLTRMARAYGIDRAAEALEERGHRDYAIEAGDEVATRGKDAASEPWNVGIRKPGPGAGEVLRSVPLSGFSLSTTGDYRGSDLAEGLAGKLHAHLVDPRSGRPLDHGLLSVTVLGDSCLTAAALSEGLLVLGPDQGFRRAVEQDLPALFLIRKEGGGLEERATPAFAELFY